MPHMGARRMTPLKGKRPLAAAAMATAPPMDSPWTKKGMEAGRAASCTAAGCRAKMSAADSRGGASPPAGTGVAVHGHTARKKVGVGGCHVVCGP